MSKLGNTIKSLRVRDNLTQDELAKYLAVSRSTIGMYEQGKREPNMEIMEKIADFFNVDMNYLLGINKNLNKTEYYLDLKTQQMAQEILENEELKALFDATRNASPRDLEITRSLLLNLKRNKPEND